MELKMEQAEHEDHIITTDNGELLWYNSKIGCYQQLNPVACGASDNEPHRVLVESQLQNTKASTSQTGEQYLDDEELVPNKRIWDHKNTLFLIDCVKNLEAEFQRGMKKNVWQKVAAKCAHLHKDINATQCETKWKTLKRTYKTITLNNNTSGQKRKNWEYFDVMNEILFHKPEINPVATCSSRSGLKLADNENKKNADSDGETEMKACPKDKSEKFETSFMKKRKARESEATKRHNEKMARLDRFNDIFSKLVDKM